MIFFPDVSAKLNVPKICIIDKRNYENFKESTNISFKVDHRNEPEERLALLFSAGDHLAREKFQERFVYSSGRQFSLWRPGSFYQREVGLVSETSRGTC